MKKTGTAFEPPEHSRRPPPSLVRSMADEDHEVASHTGNHKILTRLEPEIIDALKERGYVFVTVPQLPAPGRAEPGEVCR